MFPAYLVRFKNVTKLNILFESGRTFFKVYNMFISVIFISGMKPWRRESMKSKTSKSPQASPVPRNTRISGGGSKKLQVCNIAMCVHAFRKSCSASNGSCLSQLCINFNFLQLSIFFRFCYRLFLALAKTTLIYL